jgi:hypothetical protein
MPLIASDANDRASQIMTLTERLTAVLLDEIAWLGEHRTLMGAPFMDEKMRLSNLYRLEMMRIAEDKSLLDLADKTLLAKLRRATGAFQEAVADNATALNAAKDLTEGLVQAIAAEAASSRAGPATYGSQGTNTPIAGTAARGIAFNTQA